MRKFGLIDYLTSTNKAPKTELLVGEPPLYVTQLMGGGTEFDTDDRLKRITVMKDISNRFEIE